MIPLLLVGGDDLSYGRLTSTLHQRYDSSTGDDYPSVVMDMFSSSVEMTLLAVIDLSSSLTEMITCWW